MKNPKILYILISIFCVFAIIAGIYAQFIDTNHGGLNTASGGNESTGASNNTIEETSQTEIKARI